MKKKTLKNRTLIGAIIIVVAILFTFIVTPIINRLAAGTIDVVVLAQNVQRGTQITAKDLTIKQVSANALPHNTIKDASTIVGSYATATLFAGDFLTPEKLTANPNGAEDTFATLDGTQLAISFPISSFAAGLSGKLENGDVISLIVASDGNSFIPKALQYVRVVTTTTSEGIDQDQVTENVDGSFSLPATVTVLATPEQAKLITQYIKSASIHVSLVCRSNSDHAQGFLDKQTAYLENKDWEEAKEGIG